MELLFESRTNLGGMSGDLRFFQHAPRVHPEPVLVPDGPGDGRGVSIYGSVLQDGGKLRMWYRAVPVRTKGLGDGAFVAYAESEDGLTWRKPALNVLPDASGGANLTNLGLASATVFIDPDSPPSHRYRAVGCGRDYNAGNAHGPQQSGYCTKHSADGLRWELDAFNPRWRSRDVVTSIYHPGRRAGIVSMKYVPRWMRIARRSIHTAEFRDGQYSDNVPALYPDEYDDVCAAARGYHSCDYYGMGMMPAGQAIVGFLWNYWHALPYARGRTGAQGLYGTSDVSLVYQPCPNGKWFHMPGRPDFIDHNALPWTRGWINTASNVVEVGDEQRIYFSGRVLPHGFGLDEHWKPTGDDHDLVFDKSGISFASWPKCRLFGFEGLSQASLNIQLDRIDRPSEIFLNYEVLRPQGSVRAELTETDTVPIAGCALDDSVALTGNRVAEKIIWKSGAIIQPSEAAKLTLHLRFARIYAYEVRPA